MKKTYVVTAHVKSSDGKSNILSTVVVTATNVQDLVHFIIQKAKDIMKSDNWQSQFANGDFTLTIDHEEVEVINL